MSQTSHRSPVVLIVEDEPLLRTLAADVFTEQGLEVLEAAHAKAALTILGTGVNVDVVFTDINMPGAMNGLELAREVHSQWPHIELVITSGRERLAAEDIPDSGEFVPKPYDLEKVAKQIFDIVGRH